jgi:biotin carboxylase
MKAIALFDPVGSGELLKSAAKELGFKVVAIFTQPTKSFENLYHTTEQSLFHGCDEIIFANNKEEILQKIKSSKFIIEGACAASEGAVELADQIADALNLWRNRLELSKARRDKGEMRKALKKSGLSCPDFTICYTEQEAIQFASAHQFPLMIKTPQGVMTSQVYECNDRETLIQNFHRIFGKANIYGGIATYCVLEEYISGTEYILDTFSDGNSVRVTDIWVYEKIDSEIYKNIYYNAFSLSLSDPAFKPLIDYAIRVAELFGIERGPAHIELKDDPVQGPTLIEIGARLSGGGIPQMIKKYTNFDPCRASIDVFVHGKTSIPSPIVYKKHLAIVCFPQMKGGKVKNIGGIDFIQQLSSYDFHRLSVKEGDTIPPSTCLASIPLMGFFAHADRDQLLKDVSSAHQLFMIDYA